MVGWDWRREGVESALTLTYAFYRDVSNLDAGQSMPSEDTVVSLLP
jgi:hypothetical protein